MDLVYTPLGWIWLAGLVLAGTLAVRLRRGTRVPISPRWPIAALALWLALWIFSAPVFAGWLAGSLDRAGLRWPAPPAWSHGEAPDLIVVFAAGFTHPEFGSRAPLSAASLERLHAALAASRRWPAARVLFSGGSKEGYTITAGIRMAQEALANGLAPERLLVEARSRDTRENALYTAGVAARVGARRIALVTSADHMLRSRASLLVAGYDSLPVPSSPPLAVRFRAENLTPDAEALARTTSVVHEVLGIAAYRVRGWIGG